MYKFPVIREIHNCCKLDIAVPFNFKTITLNVFRSSGTFYPKLLALHPQQVLSSPSLINIR